ncbi:hypothetical protein [Streptomyces sp. NPDC046985]|uniref:hypothetical protein n=1 Tax=Streptomyces sp. NPDC046985 TaxID=3155377 RepID=UPI0033FF4EAF
MPAETQPHDVALAPVLILLGGAARRAAEAAHAAYAVADTLASDPAVSTRHTATGDLHWQRATALRAKAGELRRLVTDPAATPADRVEAAASAHALIASR